MGLDNEVPTNNDLVALAQTAVFGKEDVAIHFFFFGSGVTSTPRGGAANCTQVKNRRGGGPQYSASPVYGWCASDCAGIAQAIP